MSTALLVEIFNQLPERLVRGPGSSPQGIGGGAGGAVGGGGEERDGKPVRAYPGGKARWRAALDGFKKQVGKRYNLGTLQRLLGSHDPRARRAAVFALGQVGTMEVNASVAACLHDDDSEVSALAAEALWALWFHADTTAHNDALDRLVRLRDREKALAGIDRLIEQSPAFAEAYNQRAILMFRLKQFDRAVADCEKALQLNPLHYGALAGLGQCYLQMRKHRPALKAFRNALRINPHLGAVAEAVRALENALGDDKKSI